ncbi:MAG: hypothetical protein J0H55_14590 [Chitinophagaceae bacterium]|nr:hypothetical protein [Chitinophagaceae bacterium]
MKKLFVYAILIVSFTSCSEENIDKSDSLTSGRGFIEASLKGDYIKAEKYMLIDSTNEQYLDGLKDFSKKLTPLEREGYRDADIIIDSTKSPNDSTSFIFYKNTFKNEPTRLKVIKKGADWLVDFKFTFLGDQNASNNQKH